MKRNDIYTENMEIKEAVSICFKTLGKKEVHVNEIAESIIQNISEFKDYNLDEIKKKVNAFLAANVRSKSPIYAKVQNPKTRKARKGLYKLKPSPKNKPIIKVAVQPELPIGVPRTAISSSGNKRVDFNCSDCDKIFYGKGGEFSVVSELLFRGYNASIMSVDEGIDITASKGDKFFFIQVKTSFFKDDKISVFIKPNNFINSSTANIFYVIVFRYPCDGHMNNRFLILQNGDIDRMLHGGYISKSESGMTIKVKQDNRGLFIYNRDKEEDATYYLDNFELIR